MLYSDITLWVSYFKAEVHTGAIMLTGPREEKEEWVS
jgi:hypothetical protein